MVPSKEYERFETVITDIKTQVRSIEIKVNDLEKSTAVSDEKVKMVYNILNEIKESMNTIESKIDAIEKQPLKKWDNSINLIIAVVLTFFINVILKMIMKGA